MRWCCGCWGKSIRREPLPRREWRAQFGPATSVRSATRISTSRYLKCCGAALLHRRAHIEALVNVSRTHEMEMWTAYGKFLAPWSRRGADGTDAVLAEMRDGIATLPRAEYRQLRSISDDRAGRGGGASGRERNRHWRPSTTSLAIPSGVASAGSLQKRTAFAAIFCSSAIR